MKKIYVIIAMILMLSFSFTVVNAASVKNQEYQLKSVTGEQVSTLAKGKDRILFFFNIQCSHCQDIEEDLKKGFRKDVEIVMAESSKTAVTADEAREFYEDCGIDAAYCYDANEICWEYLKLCGYDAEIVVKPVIIYIDKNNSIKGYTTSGVNIFEEAGKRGIYLDKNRIKGSEFKTIKRSGSTIKLTWKKGSNNTGYQIKYSTSSRMNNAKKLTVKSRNTLVKKLKLKKNKKYYFSIRTYKKSKGKMNYSYWSEKSII